MPLGWISHRDADDQAVVGLPVQAFERKPGDLIFTSEIVGGPVTHVVMVWDEGRVIDASYPDGLTIRPLSVLLEANRWVKARTRLILEKKLAGP